MSNNVDVWATIRDMHRRHHALVAIALAVAVTAGCAGDGDADDSAPSTPAGSATTPDTATETTTPGTGTTPPATADPVDPDDDEAAVLAAVDCYWDTIVAANDPPDPDHPGFDRCFTGAALERSRGNVEERRLLGQRVEDATGIEPLDIRVVDLTESMATVEACFVDDAVLIDVAADLVLNDVVETVAVRVSTAKTATGWQVADSELLASTTDDSACDAL